MTIDVGRPVDVVGGEMRADAVIVDVDPRGLAIVESCSRTRRAAAPGQELRIRFDVVDELEHLRARGRGRARLLVTQCTAIRRATPVRAAIDSASRA